MDSYAEEPIRPSSPVWPAATEAFAREPRPQRRPCYLLDVETDLAEEFDPQTRNAVRQAATVSLVEVPVGECRLWTRFLGAAEGPGLLILDGVIAADVHVGERTASELVGAGDLLQPCLAGQDDLVDYDAAWRVLVPARLAVLDAAFAKRVRPWPQITEALLRRSARRVRDLSVQRAISSHPRLELRLALMLWHLAARWGRVEPGGIRLGLPLTHRLLGQLVGAERPSVSHALGRLADSGLVTGGGADWHLHGTSEKHFAWLIDHHLERWPRALPSGA
jgi:CRP/FNR family cyclic AMP-dependent transcriptional regulator